MPVFRPASATQINAGLLIARMVIGLTFVAHGAQKFFVMGIPALVGGFGQMGIAMPAITAPAVVFVEIFAGLALAIGLLTRVASVGLVVVMLGAGFIAHGSGGFFLPTGYEFTLVLGSVATMFAITGAGAWSVDARIARRS